MLTIDPSHPFFFYNLFDVLIFFPSTVVIYRL
jgi:hypothetical protein